MSLEQQRTPALAEVIRAAVSSSISGLAVALPGKIEKYDSTLQKADVKPLLKRTVIGRDGTETAEALPVIPEVPVVFPRGGGYFLSLPIEKGDLVLLVVCDRSIDDFAYSTGTTDTDPVDLRSHDLSDAVAFPGFYPFTKPIKSLLAGGAAFGQETGAQVRANGSAIEITSNGLPASIGGFVALANLLITAFNTHTHPTAGTGAPSVPTVPWTLPMIASSNLKAD
jgi:hypothetical protein